jgi:hypothetical protein
VFRSINKGGSIAGEQPYRPQRIAHRQDAAAPARQAVAVRVTPTSWRRPSQATRCAPASPPPPPSMMRPATASRATCATAAWTRPAVASGPASSGPSRGSRGSGSESELVRRARCSPSFRTRSPQPGRRRWAQLRRSSRCNDYGSYWGSS